MSKAGKNNLLKIAQILKSNGADGELVFSFRGIAPEDINIAEPVFVYFDGLQVPYFISTFQKRGNSKALVRLTDIENNADAEEVLGKDVFIEADEETQAQQYEDFSILIGWFLFSANVSPDEELENIVEIGEILDYIDIPNNPCLEVGTKNGEVMIPLHEDLILSIDPENQEVIMSIPEGLLE